LFPSSFCFKKDIDIFNFNSGKCEIFEKLTKKKKALDSGIYVIDNEFDAMKNRQIQKKNINMFMQSKFSVDDRLLHRKFDLKPPIRHSKLNKFESGPRFLK